MEFSRISVIENESQAQVLHQALEDRGIPHLIKSYHDSAYDGLFQLGAGWGQIDAPDGFKAEILSIIQELNQPLTDQDSRER
jgi:hypothetical protein